jgi:hypothetical protein
MQRLLSVPLAAALTAALMVTLVPAPARAQLIQRDRSADEGAKPKDAASDKARGDAKKPAADDDDDILAPIKTDKDKKSPVVDTPAAQKAMKVGVVALVPVGDAGKTLADQATAGVIKELSTGALFDAVPLTVDVKTSASGGVDEATAKQAVADGTATLEKARALLEKLAFGKAKKGFEMALESLEKGAGQLADPQLLVECRLGLAEVAARQGQEQDADAQLALAAALNPELELDGKKYPNQFIRSFVKARDRILKDKRGSLLVDATGAGATVEVDGRAAEAAPVKVSELPAGRHLVRALREGLPAWGTVVEVKAGGDATVSPGFIAADGKSYVDELQNNRLSPDAAKAVADAAKAQGLRAAVVGVVSKTMTSVPVQLVLIDAGSGNMARLPTVTYQGDLLDLSIETLKAREGVEGLLGDKAEPKAFTNAPLATLLEGAKAGAEVKTASVVMRYEVKAMKERQGSRLVTAEKKPDDEDEVSTGGDDEGGTKVLSAGKTGTRKRLDDEDDPYANANKKDDGTTIPDPDAPLTEQPWFWPTVVGGGAAALVVIGGVTVVTLIATDVLPDPRPANGGQVKINLPK